MTPLAKPLEISDPKSPYFDALTFQTKPILTLVTIDISSLNPAQIVNIMQHISNPKILEVKEMP